MRLAVITDEIAQDFEHALDVMQEYNVQHAELRGLWGTNIADLSPEQVQRAQTALKTRGMETVCLATPFYKCDFALNVENAGEEAGRMHLARPRGFEEQMQILARCCDLAEVFNTTFIRVFSFWRKEVLTPELEDRIVEAFAEPVEYAKKRGMTLLLENEHACFIGTGAEAARIAKRVDSPHFQLVWDPGNAFYAEEKPFPDGYEAVKPWLKHIHIKDAVLASTPHGVQPQWCVIGEGEIDYVGHFSALKRDGYNGFLSLETHYIPKTGSGENGKGTPEDGSRPCLSALNKMLAN